MIRRNVSHVPQQSGQHIWQSDVSVHSKNIILHKAATYKVSAPSECALYCTACVWLYEVCNMMGCAALVCFILTIPWAAMSAARVLLPEVPGVQSDRRTSCPPTRVRSISISTASACSALSYSTTPKPRTGLPSSWASWETWKYMEIVTTNSFK